ncbi:MAG TPA: divalent metal cation transporter [Pirellulaceae bacterium]|nr:divalent metal cation transporter [Pirellulaceae bacterium]HMO93173.1 divalent metal cation transporter [Pirellulaceae bacterium]HMP69998.1 divalent metal cation transporter [Pirellulaceae bacterium]
MKPTKLESNREQLLAVQGQGVAKKFGVYFRLSGPGWLQSAITLGGGTLGSTLYLGMLSGTGMLWLQILAIIIGVIMLSAISYVTLSTGKRPFAAINEHINPVLGVGWVAATILANMIWIMPQFSLCYDSIQTCLGGTSDSNTSRITISLVLGVLALAIVAMNCQPGKLSKIFDWGLKSMVGFVVVCFVLVVVTLAIRDSLNWTEIIGGYVPNLKYWSNPSQAVQQALSNTPAEIKQWWADQIVARQQSSMVSVTATAVGLNMTFLLPYSLLIRGWDKPFRGLARFDLIGALAIPFIIVTSCIVIASAHAFHAKADANLLSGNPEQVKASMFFNEARKLAESRIGYMNEPTVLAEFESLSEPAKTDWLAAYLANLEPDELRVMATLIKPNSRQLATTLAPLLGETNANLVFGLGALAMAFSTIVILMMINGFAIAEIIDRYDSVVWRLVGSAMAMLVGIFWWQIWQGESQTWLVVVASTFGAILLPIAYISFFAMMNNARLLQTDIPRGRNRWLWNLLMGVGVCGALVQAYVALVICAEDAATGRFVLGGVAMFALLALIGFAARKRESLNQREV